MDNKPLAMPSNYPSFWSADENEWITQDDFIINFGPLTYVQPTHNFTYLFQSDTILELRKTYTHVHSPYLIRAYVELDTNLGWIEIVDFEEVTSFFPGCETYEQGTYLGVIDKVTTFKEMIIDKFWEINYDRDENYSQGDDDDWENDFSIEKWNGGKDDFDMAYGAEVTNS